jgi:ANTAR domain-containing protein
LPIDELGPQAAELLSLTYGGEARSLNKLAELAAWQVPACAGAHAAVWRDGDVIGTAASHPDLAELADLQLTTGQGPLIAAADAGLTVSCPDTLEEVRWPDYADAALRRGVRSSVHLVRELPGGALVLSLFSVRPGVLDAQSNPVADMLAAFGGAMLANATAYNQAHQAASQLKEAVVARSVVDQAKGILMHALDCDAPDALRRLRRESQRRHVKVTEVAAEVVAAYGGRQQKDEGPAGLPQRPVSAAGPGGLFTLATRMVRSSRSWSSEKLVTRLWIARAVSAAEWPARPASSSARLSSK